MVSLKALDSEGEKGIRDLLPEQGHFSKPIISPDGKTVVFSDRAEQTILAVDWDGSNLRTLGPGFASDVWRDPVTAIDWVYLRTGNGETEDPIARFRLDDPKSVELVWDRTANGTKLLPWFQLSADGKRFADAFPWNKCGVGDLLAQDWQWQAEGCWPGIAPDNSYRSFVFLGSHQHLQMFDSGGTNSRKIKLTGGSIPPKSKCFHPSWSNDARFFTMTSPKISKLCELYLCRFDSHWNEIESRLRITTNNIADIFGDAWIQQPDGAIVASAEPVEPAETEEAWFESSKGLVWLWDSAKEKNEVSTKDGSIVCRGKVRERARFGARFQLLLDGGFFEANYAGAKLVEETLRDSGEFSFEAIVTPLEAETSEPKAIAVLPGGQLTLRQDGKTFLIDGLEPRFGDVVLGQSIHLAVVCREGRVEAFLDGKLVADGNLKPKTQISESKLIFGGDWRGELEAIAIFDRQLPESEVARHATLLRDRIAAPRTPVSVVDATLIEASRIPSLKEIEPYVRALVENVYDVEQVISGNELSAKRVVVFQWTILDETVLDPVLKAGDSVRLHLSEIAAHPELAGEYQVVGDHGEFDAPLFFDERSHRRSNRLGD